MRLTCEVRIAQPPGAVFDTLLEVERVARCVPGGRLTGRAAGAGGDAARHTGEATVDVGPLRATYVGTVRYLDVEREARTVVLRASGREQGGQGDADARLVAWVLPDGADAASSARSVLSVDVDLLVRGRVAQLGRGVVGELGRRLIAEFAGNLERLLTEEPPSALPAVRAEGLARKRPTKAVAMAVGAAGAVAAGALLGRWLRRGRAASGRHFVKRRYVG